MDCLCGDSASYEANVEAVELDLVRCFVDQELKDVGGGWDPWKTPWLTIDSEDIQQIVKRLTCLAAAEYRPKTKPWLESACPLCLKYAR